MLKDTTANTPLQYCSSQSFRLRHKPLAQYLAVAKKFGNRKLPWRTF